jgi:hypothetical protein
MQIPASDKVYEYILFRGSDIKDLQVKSSPPPPPPQAASLHNDPAIIQSHYSQPASTSSSLPSAGGTVAPDLSSQAAQYGLQRPSFQSNLPLYQPGNTPWGSSVAPQAEMLPHFQFPQCIGKDTMGLQVDCHLICSNLLCFSPHQDCRFPRISNIQDLILLCHLGCKSCRNSNPH